MFLKSHKEAREQLQQMQNPLFLYDNDADGLSSFILLRRWMGRGTGAAVRSYPDVSDQYLQKIDYLNSDGVIILDKHSVSDAFIEGVKERGLSIVWIDHHENPKADSLKESSSVFYFNPRYTIKAKNSYPVALQTYKVTEQKRDAWIALAGCIGDCYLPPLHKDFAKSKPELWGRGIKTAFDAYYKTEIGKIALYMNFSLKNSANSVLEMQDFMLKAKEPEEVLSESDTNPVVSYSAGMLKKCLELVEQARKTKKGKTIFFTYSGSTSMSSEISNMLIYEFPKHYIGVAFMKEGAANISLRGKNVNKILEEILSTLGAGTGGGHPDAVGSRIPRNKLEEFENLFRKMTEKIKA